MWESYRYNYLLLSYQLSKLILTNISYYGEILAILVCLLPILVCRFPYFVETSYKL